MEPMSLNHSLRDLRKNFPSCRWKYAKCLRHMQKTPKSQNTALRMDRSVLNPSSCGLWNLAGGSEIPAPGAAVLGLQHHGQFCGGRIGSVQHLALCLAPPNCTYSSPLEVAPRRTRATLFGVSRGFCCSAFAGWEANSWTLL